jgi:hypothetical protein
MVTLEQKLDEILYNGRWETLHREASRYVASAERAFGAGDYGGAFVFLQHAKAILGIKDEAEE